MKIAVYWGDPHTLPENCDSNTFHSFYNAGWKYGFESLGHEVKYFAWGDDRDNPGFDLYVYAPGFLSNLTFKKKIHKPNIFFTEEVSMAPCWAVGHSFYYDHVCTLDYMNYTALKANGLKNVHWLPGAYDPTVFKDLKIKRTRSATFLGTYDPVVQINEGKTRIDYIRDIDAKIPNSMVARGYYAHEANKLWNNTLVGIDVPIVEFTSFRLFQIIMAGAMCLTRKPRIEAGWDKLFLNQEIVDTYENSDDLCNAVAPYWIKQVKKREERVKKSMEFVSKYHSFKNRAWQILNITGLREDLEPWSGLANLPS